MRVLLWACGQHGRATSEGGQQDRQSDFDPEASGRLRGAAAKVAGAVATPSAVVGRHTGDLLEEWHGDAPAVFGPVVYEWQHEVTRALIAVEHSSEGLGLVHQIAATADAAHSATYAQVAARLGR